MIELILQALTEAHKPTDSTIDYADVVIILKRYLSPDSQSQVRNLSEILVKIKSIVDIEDDAIILKVLTEITEGYTIIKK